MSLLVRSPDDLTADWAQKVLAAHGEQVEVRHLERTNVDVGTTTRVRLWVDHGGTLPRRWFIKLPSGSWKARAITALPQLPQTEVRFYNEVAQDVPVMRPRALAAESRFGRGYTLVLGDVTEGGATPGRSGEALSVERAGAMVELLARVHACFWQSPRLEGDLAWLAGPVRRLEDGLGSAMAVPLMKRGLKRAGDLVSDVLGRQAVGYARRRKAAMRLLSSGPLTLVHHDPHPGNLYWKGEAPGLLDWQLVRVGEGLSDVAYLLATALEPEVRREAETELLARWADTLAACGTVKLELADVQERYRLHTAYPFEAMVVTLAVGGLMEDAVAHEMVRRTAAAVADADGFAAVAAAL